MLKFSDVRPGAVAYFDVSILNNDPYVRKPYSPATRNGPFLCYANSNGHCCWVEITTQPGNERLEILKEWRTGGSATWQVTPQYVNDGRTTYCGSTQCFLNAANDTEVDRFNPKPGNRRPQVCPKGVEIIAELVKERGGKNL